MKKKPRKHDEKLKAAVVKAFTEGTPATEIADKYGINKTQIYVWARRGKEEGVPGRKRKNPRAKNQPVITTDDVELMTARFLGTLLGTLSKVLVPALRQLVDLAVQRKLAVVKQQTLAALEASS